jgi:methyltransferase (TIGR00027 family)
MADDQNPPATRRTENPDKARKVIAINGSPNKEKGNTALILNPFLEGMKDAGAAVELYYTEDLTINPCKGDGSCWTRTPGRCIYDDDMTWLLPEMNEADILVIASPLHGWGVSSPTKTLLDRTVSRVQPFMELHDGTMRHTARPDGRPQTLVLVSNCGFWELNNFDPLLAQIDTWCRHESAMTFAGALLRPHGPAFRAMIEKGAPVTDVTEAARQAGRQLILEGTISREALDTISRPLLPVDAYMQIINRQFAELRNEPAKGDSTMDHYDSLMKRRSAGSITAEIVALIRASETDRPAGERICYDPYAGRFIRPELIAYFQSLPPEKLLEQRANYERSFPGQQTSILTRVRFFDDMVKKEIAEGISQVVIVGAGYDTRAYRIEGIDRARVFEIDREETQAVKMATITRIFGALPPHVSYIPLDLMTGDLESSLAEAGFDSSRRALFIMEGLLYYLPPPAVHKLLGGIARKTAPGSVALFDYHPQSMIDGTHPLPVAEKIRRHVEKAGEPLLFGIPDGGAEKFLRDLGFKNVRDVTDTEYLRALFPDDSSGRRASGLLGFCRAEV